MKRLFILLSVLVLNMMFMLTGCTQQTMTRHLGGTTTIDLPPDYKCVNATWKEANLWVMLKPMDSTYVPQTLLMQEYSEFGIIEGKIIIKESKTQKE